MRAGGRRRDEERSHTVIPDSVVLPSGPIAAIVEAGAYRAPLSVDRRAHLDAGGSLWLSGKARRRSFASSSQWHWRLPLLRDARHRSAALHDATF
jgi:hypothetical protein